jgi:putative transposase
VLRKAEIAISMGACCAWRDGVFLERLWRTIKYDDVYLRANDSLSEARPQVGRYPGAMTPGVRTQALTGKLRDLPYVHSLQKIPPAASPMRRSIYPNTETCSGKPNHLCWRRDRRKKG